MKLTNKYIIKQWNERIKASYIDQVHLFLVVHVVDSQTALVDEAVQTWVLLHQQFVLRVGKLESLRVGNLVGLEI